MEIFLVHFAHAAAWAFLIVFIFAIIGFVATIRWIASLFQKTELAVDSGVRSVEDKISHH